MFSDLTNPSLVYFSVTEDGKRKWRVELKLGDRVVGERVLSTFAKAYESGRLWTLDKRLELGQ